MMRFLSRLRTTIRRGEVGQSIIILALGFIALAAFVGITTDISVAFVRYNQLSRAVDSAAIAAANQMRQDTSHATLGLAARQFIEFHGIRPEQVDVLTCLTRPGDPNLCTDDQAKLVQVVAFIESPTFFMRLLGFESFELWASSISQTAALDVVLIIDVSESMLTETSYSDWVGIQTIGERFGEVAKTENLGVVYRPPTVIEILSNKGADPVDGQDAFWQTDDLGFPGLLNHPQIEVNNRLYYINEDGSTTGVDNTGADSAYTVRADRNFFNTEGEPFHLEGGTLEPQYHPREACRVRFYPSSVSYRANVYPAYTDEDGETTGLGDVYGTKASLPALPASRNGRLEGFVPVHNFYGCCNDPDGDFSFADLVCQPFKQARDASFEFLERIDFTRGDRAAIVTFDRSAFLVNPYGSYADAGGNTIQPGAMMDNGTHAFRTLRDLVGVRAEPNFYVFNSGTMDVVDDGSGNLVLAAGATPLTAAWTGFSAGLDDNGQSIPINYEGTGHGATDGSQPLNYLYPVYDTCPFRNAAEINTSRTLFDYALSNISLPNGFNGTDGDTDWTRWPVHDSPGAPYPNALQGATGGLTISNPGDPQRIMDPRRSYELWASCAGTNIGAALREGNNALLDPQTVRRFGTIWVMVFLGDGAAGASDPVRRNGNKLTAANPYQDMGGGVYGLAGQYGAFSLCPYGTPDNPGRLVSPDLFPFCSSGIPWTRRTCDFRPRLTLPPFNDGTAMRDNDYVVYDPLNPAGPPSQESELAWNRERNNLYDIDLGSAGDYTRCHELYDVDDYARDWADYIGLEDLQGTEAAQLPTIFTIGFRLPFSQRVVNGVALNINDPDDAVQICLANPGDCAGEQMLRYIADVGDNNRIDNDFWQDWHEDGNIDGFLASGGFGSRGPCQRVDQTHSSGSYAAIVAPAGDLSDDEFYIQYGMLPPRTSCGNYFFAPDGNELRFVFDEIASRMFTRLAR